MKCKIHLIGHWQLNFILHNHNRNNHNKQNNNNSDNPLTSRRIDGGKNHTSGCYDTRSFLPLGRRILLLRVNFVKLESVCMYVCIEEVALRGDAHGIGRSNWAKGRDPSGSWVQYPNPAVPFIPRRSRWTGLAHLCVFSDPTLL